MLLHLSQLIFGAKYGSLAVGSSFKFSQSRLDLGEVVRGCHVGEHRVDALPLGKMAEVNNGDVAESTGNPQIGVRARSIDGEGCRLCALAGGDAVSPRERRA